MNTPQEGHEDQNATDIEAESFTTTPGDAAIGVDPLETSQAVDAIDLEALPTLWRDRSFLGMASTQFFGAFNDNLFKQLMLLLAVALWSEQDLQGYATTIFALPFVLFSGYAGYLSDRNSKKSIIVLAKVAEIVCMGLGVVMFLSFSQFGIAGLFFVLFLMGMQSAFFGPGKYGILPEMLREKDLPRANGIILMLTFMAIIFGTVAAGVLLDVLYGMKMVKVAGIPKEVPNIPEDGVWRIWIASQWCVFIAIAGTLTSLLIRRTPIANKGLKFRWSSLTVPPEMRRLLKDDIPLSLALLASCAFWMIAAIVAMAVNAFGVKQLEKTFAQTSYMMAAISIGIAVGAVVAGRVSRGKVDFRIVRIGAWGLLLCLVLMSLPNPAAVHGHLLGFSGSLVVLIIAGVSAGMFAIPLQVFIQSRPPVDRKGRMIAVMNQANFIAILLAGPIYNGFAAIVQMANLSQCALFGLTALLMAPIAVFYRPRNMD